MSVTIKGKKCRNICEMVAWNDYRISKLVGEGIEECVHKLGDEAVSGQPYHFPYHFVASFDNTTRKLNVKLWTITLDNKKTLVQYEQDVLIPASAAGSATWGTITGDINSQADLMALINGKSAVSVSATGTATDTVSYITVNGVEKKLAGGGEPSAYLKSADVSVTNTLKLKNKDNTDTTFTVDFSKYTLQTTAPSAAATDGGIHIVILSSEPATKYDGYIYLINEE